MTEAIDTELRTLLDRLDARAVQITGDSLARWWDTTTIIFLGDNGTPSNGVISLPFPANQGKDSAFNGGVHVPLYIAGSAVNINSRGQVSDALVNGVDLFATIAAIAGVFDEPGIDVLTDITGYGALDFDSIDLTPILDDYTADVRDWIYSENWDANTDQFPVKYGEERIIMGRYDDGTGAMGLYKLWVHPPSGPFIPESRYTSNGLYYGDKFYEISKDDGNNVTDEFEGTNLVTGDDEALSPSQEVAYFDLRTKLKALVGF